MQYRSSCFTCKRETSELSPCTWGRHKNCLRARNVLSANENGCIILTDDNVSDWRNHWKDFMCYSFTFLIMSSSYIPLSCLLLTSLLLFDIWENWNLNIYICLSLTGANVHGNKCRKQLIKLRQPMEELYSNFKTHLKSFTPSCKHYQSRLQDIVDLYLAAGAELNSTRWGPCLFYG